MTATLPARVTAGLRGRLSGHLALPGEEEYEVARQVWNASHDYRPVLVVQPRSADDTRAAVRFAADHGLPVCVRGGGHNHAGYAVAADVPAVGVGGATLGGGTGPATADAVRGAAEDVRCHGAYGDAAYARLAAVKACYDPGNTLRFNQNIRSQPAAARHQ